MGASRPYTEDRESLSAPSAYARQAEIVFRDAWLIVLNKPSGLLAVPGRGSALYDSLAVRVQQDFPTASVVHRLDRDTSGLMVLALDPQTHRRLSRQFEQRSVEKVYTAVVAGQVWGDSGRVSRPLAKDFSRPPRHKVDLEQGREAITDWRVVERRPDRTRLWLQPLTGRSHQLRVHLADLGHPILGDPLYGSEVERQAAPRLLLHAQSLTLSHPATGLSAAWQCPCPFGIDGISGQAV